MRRKFPGPVERGRELAGPYASDQGDRWGRFMLRTNRGATLWVIASADFGWDHVSVSLEDRTPTWEEMCWVKSLFFEAEECVVQYHPPKSNYVNNYEYCLHMWRPHGRSMRMPPEILV